MKTFERVFVPHPNYRFSTAHLERLAKEIVYVCDTPMFDDMLGEEYADRFEGKVAVRMNDFDPNEDVIAFYGDPMIFTLMVAWVTDKHDEYYVARFSQKEDCYKVKMISLGLIEEMEANAQKVEMK